ncbi:MAG TPA: helix-turn-helix transcriptional regulator [Longimicrobiaceae bacterium]|nr:helix-turn-helix transcriptional regulator [Longimicrobiaceae bacterium]
MKRSDNDLVVLTPGVRSGRLASVEGRVVGDEDDLTELYLRLSGTRRPHVWISDFALEFAPLAAWVHESRGDLRLLLLSTAVRPAQKEYLSTIFRCVLTLDRVNRFLPMQELAVVMGSPERNDLFIAGVVDPVDRVVVLYRGNLDRLIVPFAWFTSGKSLVEPDFEDFAPADYGNTIRLGSYEASADAILYEFDPEYRRRAKRRELRQDVSFGASLRRLRLMRGVSRDDFPGIAARTIARIERGEVERPREETLHRIAQRLGVTPEEIPTY